MYEEYFPERLAQLRTRKGVSARDMSLSLGQADNYINSIENRKMLPSMAAFFYICEYLCVSPREFFEEDNPYPTHLSELIIDLKKLDENALKHMSWLVSIIVGRK